MTDAETLLPLSVAIEATDWVNKTDHPIDDYQVRCIQSLRHYAQQKAPEQDDDVRLVDDITCIVREADDVFKKVGGSSRHWTRDCFLPLLNKAGLIVQRSAAPPCEVAPIDVDAIIRECRHDSRWTNIRDEHIEAIIKWMFQYHIPSLIRAALQQNRANQAGVKRD